MPTSSLCLQFDTSQPSCLHNHNAVSLPERVNRIVYQEPAVLELTRWEIYTLPCRSVHPYLCRSVPPLVGPLHFWNVFFLFFFIALSFILRCVRGKFAHFLLLPLPNHSRISVSVLISVIASPLQIKLSSMITWSRDPPPNPPVWLSPKYLTFGPKPKPNCLQA